MANSITKLARAIEEREGYLSALLEADYETLSEEEHKALMWLRDNAVGLLADYLVASQLVLDAYPLVDALDTMSKKDAMISNSASAVAEQTSQWLRSFDA